MNALLGTDFLLSSPLARTLYHEIAADLPIVDFHNHLPPDRVATNAPFRDLSEVWLEGDHYKWRAMRACGEAEAMMTGRASPRDTFDAYARTVPQTQGNPLFAWSHLELRRYFGITELLSPASAESIWQQANERLREPGFTPRGLLERFRVELIGTTDDPADTLEHHVAFARDTSAKFRMVPTFRPDQAFAANGPAKWNAWRARLESTAGLSIGRLADLLDAFYKRIEFFATLGCRMADHGLTALPARYDGYASAARAFDALLAGQDPTAADLESMRIEVLMHVAEHYARLGWTAQFHLGALRNPNSRRFAELGPDTGYDTIGDSVPPSTVASLLDRFANAGRLPNVILYNLNPADNAAFSALCGSFPVEGRTAAVRHGAAWWFLDQRRGIEEQLEQWSLMGLVSQHPGMVTDSRSFLSFPRHEYFRRVLCHWLAAEHARGLVPGDTAALKPVIQRVCVDNARAMFDA